MPFLKKNPDIGPKHIVMHLFAMAMLYFGAVNFSILIFQFINIAFPDIVNNTDDYFITSSYERMRWALSSLIIVFPAYIITTVVLNKAYRANSAVAQMKTRKWLIYITLLIASLFIVGDLVTLVFRLLGGEFTITFFLKVLTILFITGSIFSYYTWELKRYTKP